jgi:hypothetical protein
MAVQETGAALEACRQFDNGEKFCLLQVTWSPRDTFAALPSRWLSPPKGLVLAVLPADRVLTHGDEVWRAARANRFACCSAHCFRGLLNNPVDL